MNSVKQDILQFLHRPAEFAGAVTEDDKQRWLLGLDQFALPRLARPGERSLREAQERAWRETADCRAALVLGPPGTGKTLTLAWMAAGYLHARRAAGLPCRVLVAGFTRESMGNLLDQFVKIGKSHLPDVPAVFMGNPPDSEMDRAIKLMCLKGKAGREQAVQFLKAEHCVCAINCWQLAKLMDGGGLPEGDRHTARLFQLVLIDEASQMPVSHALMALSGLAEGGRVLVAGDDRQLGPVQATFDTPADDGRVIGHSLYKFLKTGGVKEVRLEETFRLNRPLATFPAQHLYDGRYVSAVPDRRLPLRDHWEIALEPWQRVALDPMYPVVVLLHDGPPAATENPFERHLIRGLVKLLSERLAPADGDSVLDTQTLWGERLAVVTPHRAQNSALREELAVVPGWDQARVSTVDRFQGRERDAIISGYTVSDSEFAQQEAEFLFGFERLNVTVTRARSKLILIASRRLLEVMPAHDEVFDDAQLFREYVYECAGAGTVALLDSDGSSWNAEVRVRGFDESAGNSAAAMLDNAGALPAQPSDGSVIRLTYEAEQIESARILHELDLVGRPYTYIVATGGLKRLRTAELTAPSHQRDSSSLDPVLRFDEVLRRLIERTGRAVLGRVSERLFLQRAIKRALEDEDVKRLVAHDVSDWVAALADVAQRGLDLSEPLPPELDALLVTRLVGQTLAKLQAAHRSVRPLPDLLTFEEAAHELLKGPLQVGDVVVMEGFTFLTELQRRFVETCISHGKTVCFVHGYNPRQARGFAIMERTYAPFEHVTSKRIHVPLGDAMATQADDLARLRQGLFAEQSPITTTPASSPKNVTFEIYAHRHDEIEECMRRIKEYTDRDRSLTFAIVTRNPREFDSLLQEQARIHDLPNTIGMEPRRLLLTPLGRFALTLYAIRPEGELKMTADHFETMLASGWLGDDVQGTADLLAATRPQMFDRCQDRNEWHDAFAKLERVGAHSPDSRLPSAAVKSAVLARWRDAFAKIDDLSGRLFAGPPDQSIGGRMRQLLDELEGLDPSTMRTAEREILHRIRDALANIADTGGMKVTGTEFGEVLNGLVKEYDQDSEAGGEPPPAGAREPTTDGNGDSFELPTEPAKVWVIPPEGIDSHPVDVVFYIAVDDQRVPRPDPANWPFYETNIEKSSETERYMFLAVVRAARKRLHLSYAIRGEGATYAASPYWAEALATLGCEAVKIQSTAASTVLTVHPGNDPSLVRRTQYALHDVAIAGLCPYRYKLERLDPSARMCRDAFQMRFIAQGEWLERIYQAALGETVRGEEQISKLLNGCMSATRAGVRNMFPAIRNTHWQPVEAFVGRSLRETAHFVGSRGDYPAVITPTPVKPNFQIPVADHSVSIELGVKYVFLTGIVPWPLPGPVLHREWMLPKLTDDSTVGKDLTEAHGQFVFKSLYKAVRWWDTTARSLLRWHGLMNHPKAAMYNEARQEYDSAEREISVLVQQIETGRYPKNPGSHCQLCPARSLCLGKDEWQGETPRTRDENKTRLGGGDSGVGSR